MSRSQGILPHVVFYLCLFPNPFFEASCDSGSPTTFRKTVGQIRSRDRNFAYEGISRESEGIWRIDPKKEPRRLSSIL